MQASLAWMLLAAALACPWLMPIHSIPWTSFHSDMAMAIVVYVLALAVMLAKTAPLELPAASLAVLAVGFIPLVQYSFGLVHYLEDAWLASLYVVGFALAIALGHHLETIWPGRVVPTLFASFGLACALSLLLALNQWLQLDQWGDFTLLTLAGARPVANVAQPNKLATLLVWGMVALWWAYAARLVRAPAATAAAVLLLFGIALTQSRSGAVEVVLLAIAAVSARRRPWARGRWWMFASLFAVFVSFVLIRQGLDAALELVPPESLSSRLQPGTRLLHWRLIADAISQRPLVGWGWQQVAVAQSQLATRYPASHEIITYSHNAFLDLLVWNGMPIGGAVSVGICVWILRHWRRASSRENVLVMVTLSVLLFHSMVEYPFADATFLLASGLFVGVECRAASTPTSGKRALRAPRGLVIALLVLIGGLLILVGRDYLRIEREWTAERIRAAHIGPQIPAPLLSTPSLDLLHTILDVDRVAPSRAMSASHLKEMQLASERMPGIGSLLRLAQAEALNGQADAALETLDRLCRTHSENLCAQALTAWSGIVRKGGLPVKLERCASSPRCPERVPFD